jgi:hypothetical protein
MKIPTGNYQNLAEIEKLVEAFENHSLPSAGWTHFAHLTIGIWYLVHYPKSEATDRIRNGIKSYNLEQGVPQTVERGYHETITLFYIWLINDFLVSRSNVMSVALVNELLCIKGDKNLPFN